MKSLLIIPVVLCIAALSGNVTANAQEKNSNKVFHGKAAAYYENQATRMYQLADEALDRFVPEIGAPIERRLALGNLDMLLHDTSLDYCDAMRNFISTRLTKLIAELDTKAPKKGEILKVYNDAFIARTPKATIAFDLSRCFCLEQHFIPDSIIDAIVAHCDILFISHNHRDHADAYVAEQFLKAGKKVIAPTNWQPDDQRISHLRPEGKHSQTIALPEGRSIDVITYPGNQSDLMNNIYIVTTQDGKTFAHVGDQYNREDLKWIANIRNEIPRPDVLTVNCWTYNLDDLCAGINARLVVTGHEDEMSHTVDHREAFWLTFEKFANLAYPYLVMGWGEWYRLK